MGTSIADLFVNLGVKGDDKALSAIGNVRKGLKDTASVSLEAKAGILAAMYALEQFMQKSGERGTSLTNLDALLGGGMKQTVQQYQWAAQQVGVSNQAVANSFEQIQSAMSRVEMGKEPPAGLRRIAEVVGGISTDQIHRFVEHPEEMIQILQKYAKLETNAGVRNENLSSIVGKDMIPALTRNAFSPEMLQQALGHILSNKEVGNLATADRTWANTFSDMQLMFDKFNAKHGPEMAAQIGKIAHEVEGLMEKLLKFGEKEHVFDWISKAFTGWGLIISALTKNVDKLDVVFEGWGEIFDGISDALSKILEIATAKDPLSKLTDTATGLAKGVGEAATGANIEGAPLMDKFRAQSEKDNADVATFMRSLLDSLIGPAPQAVKIAPTMPAQSASVSAPSTVEVAQTFNFAHPGVDPRKTADSTKQAVMQAFRSLDSQARVV